MNNEQYQNLMRHLLYVESLLEKIDDKTDSEAYECPICGAKPRVYLPAGFGKQQNAVGIGLRPNAQCPKCYSLERHRALWLLMQHLDLPKENMRILHFAPEPIFSQFFLSFKGSDYWPVDLNPNYGGIRKAVDITDIPFEDNTFDLIMATHVLEHILDDRKAMRELYRVLKVGGIAFLNVPLFDIPTTFEDSGINTPELRFKHYGQDDHVRAYGQDYPQRLGEAGFNVGLFTINDEKLLKQYGINKDEKIFFSVKE